jgi:hypothetical protein
VFENLLASYNEDTYHCSQALGAFYTRREIVGYMVDEALLSYLTSRVPSVPEATIRALFAPVPRPHRTSRRRRGIAGQGHWQREDPGPQ